LSNLEQNAVRLELTGGDEKHRHKRLESLLQEASKFQAQVNQAEREIRDEIRRILRGQGIIADALDQLASPRDEDVVAKLGEWHENESSRPPRKPRTAQFKQEGSVLPLGHAYFCENGCGWVGKEYPPAPMEGWSLRVLDSSTSRLCLVCDLPVARTSDIAYAVHDEMPHPRLMR